MSKFVIADKHAMKTKTAGLYFQAPISEPTYVYLQQTNWDGSIEAPIEIDADAILELAEIIKRRREVGQE